MRLTTKDDFEKHSGPIYVVDKQNTQTQPDTYKQYQIGNNYISLSASKRIEYSKHGIFSCYAAFSTMKDAFKASHEIVDYVKEGLIKREKEYDDT